MTKKRDNKRGQWAIYVADVASGLTQAQCARKRRVSRSTVSKALKSAQKSKVRA